MKLSGKMSVRNNGLVVATLRRSVRFRGQLRCDYIDAVSCRWQHRQQEKGGFCIEYPAPSRHADGTAFGKARKHRHSLNALY
jgi:hypothetical protein